MKISTVLLATSLVLSSSSLLVPCASAQEIPPITPPGLASSLPRIRLLSLGGTISGTAKERLNVTNYGAPRLSPEDWVTALPELALFARVTPEDVRPPENAEIDEAHWLKVAKRIQELATDDSVDGIVVTHGTNTMVETGYFFSLVVNIKKPVVMVGAQRPWTGMSGDGPLNMVNAVRVAATQAATGKGVLHAMNQNVFPIRDVTKTSAYRVHTFQGIDLGVIGVADPDIVKFYAEPTRLHTFKSEFNIAKLPAALPDVEIVYGYNGTPGYIVDAMVANGVKGIVVDGTGAGSVPRTTEDAIKRAQEKGVIIVATARTRGGRVQETPRRTEAKVVPGDNLPPEKARILLQLALTKTTDLAEIKRIFDQY
ncbi:L-asparaginase [Nibricoccus aquaticus]|uniref:L-asparaginase n=1 Tax=Nibricoccus aquaticus TaxID=2576891 RepID=A0A290QLC5_9BACT|nr:asparaginase [Nibricoccus aquaticus]ATC64782.1 L-asparaginase [Nibricoccus aquaticus]